MPKRIHVVGVAGVGMSALAQHWAGDGSLVTGSDRHFDRGGGAEIRAPLERAGVEIVPQDGGGVASDTDFVAVSTAIESGNPDLARAAALSVPVRHRSECLAEIAAGHETVVVTGTSGKSTVAAMLFEILEAEGGASLLTGGAVNSLRARGLLGNAVRHPGPRLVIEGDESDGTLVAYRAPRLGVMLNLEKDHMEVDELVKVFSTFLSGAGEVVVAADPPALARFRDRPGVRTFGFAAGDLRARDLDLAPDHGEMTVDGVRFTVPRPGRHELANALAAAAAALALDVPLAASAAALARFSGVHRRFESVGVTGGIEVVDDFAHNPMKLRAAILAGRLRGRRVLAVWQPHGFGPTRLLREELSRTFAEVLRPEDRLWLPDIFYAGGTVSRDVSSKDVVDPVAAAGKAARHVPGWEELAEEVASEARPGDVVLVMGARDPDLPAHARRILDAIRSRARRLPRVERSHRRGNRSK